MNRMKKEEIKAHHTARAGLNARQVEIMDNIHALKQLKQNISGQIHNMIFPEETDFIHDDHVDAKARSRGENPMSKDYQEKVTRRRKALGVTPLERDGMCRNSDSSRYSQSIVDALLVAEDDEALKTQIKAIPENI